MSYQYVSLQYSAIQKTIHRHGRLWSLAGISAMLSRLNEVMLPRIAERRNGMVIVAGGGKFTVRFLTPADAATARGEMVQAVSTTLPMLEFQVSPVIGAENLDYANKSGLLESLRSQKRSFRGYGMSCNPHFLLCEECGEYPALAEETEMPGGSRHLCSICRMARGQVMKSAVQGEDLITIERIYDAYCQAIYGDGERPKIPLNFEDLSHTGDSEEEKKNRIAVWMSDLNSMKDMVSLWFSQNEQDVPKTFSSLKDHNISVIASALQDTFKVRKPSNAYLPFRIIIAGGDDLCIVMDEKHILEFTLSLSKSMCDQVRSIPADNPLSTDWRSRMNTRPDRPIRDLCFGGAFVVSQAQTPFIRLHEAGERLLSEAKKKTDRRHNSVSWQVISDQPSSAQGPIKFEHPLFIEDNLPADLIPPGHDALSFRKYMELASKYQSISSSHIQQIVTAVIDARGNPFELEKILFRLSSAARETDFSNILKDRHFRKGLDASRPLVPERLVTLFELMNIGGKSDE